MTPRIGFLKLRNRSMNHGSSASGDMAWDIVFMPAIKIEKPSRILPTPRLRSLPIIYIQMPIKPRIGLHAVGFIIFVRKLSPSRPDSESSQPVTVVPTFAPIMTLMA